MSDPGPTPSRPSLVETTAQQLEDYAAELREHGSKLRRWQQALHQQSLSLPERSGTISPVADADTLIDLKLAAAEARNETRFVQIDGKLDGLVNAFREKGGVLDQMVELREDNKNTRRTILTTTLGALLAVVAIVVAMVQLDAGHQANLLSAFQAVLAKR